MKPGFKSTEFWLALVVSALLAGAPQIDTSAQPTTTAERALYYGVFALVSVVYGAQRASLKKEHLRASLSPCDKECKEPCAEPACETQCQQRCDSAGGD